MKVLVLDIGNSKTKCFVFDIDVSRKYYQQIDCIHEDWVQTPRGHPWDLTDVCRVLMSQAIGAYQPDAAMITSFGDAFVLRSKRQFVHADEPADPIQGKYHRDGWPENIQITGIRALRAKHAAQWSDMHTINGWVAKELCHRAGDDPHHAWDQTHASVSGCYDLRKQKWLYEDAPVVIPSHKVVGKFEGVPILAGGMDNGFLDTANEDPYIIAGTWLVMGAKAKTDAHGKVLRSEWSNTFSAQGVRWIITGNGNYHKQFVKKVSNPITTHEIDQIFTDLEVLGVYPSWTRNDPNTGGEIRVKKGEGWWTPAPVRVLGGYGEFLVKKLCEISNKFRFYTCSQTPSRSELYQQECSALFVYKHLNESIRS